MTDELPRVVIADDDPVYRRMLEKQIGRWGYQTVVAKDGLEAKELALAEPNTTLAVFDWNMPSMNGLEACREIRQHRSESDMYIVIVSGANPTDNFDEVMHAGANDIVSKVSNPVELRSRLDSAYRRQLARRAETRTILDSIPVDNRPTTTYVVDGTHSTGPSKLRRAWLGCRQFPDSTLIPDFDPDTLQFREQFGRERLAAAARSGDITAELLDSVFVCPQCESLPTFRKGCSCCGSGRIEQEQLVHHFACAYVGRIVDFETEKGLVCPKCRARDLCVGADLEYHCGPMKCVDCHWTIDELADRKSTRLNSSHRH